MEPTKIDLELSKLSLEEREKEVKSYRVSEQEAIKKLRNSGGGKIVISVPGLAEGEDPESRPKVGVTIKDSANAVVHTRSVRPLRRSIRDFLSTCLLSACIEIFAKQRKEV